MFYSGYRHGESPNEYDDFFLCNKIILKRQTKMYQLTTDAGFASAPPAEISKETIVKNRIAIRELQVDDLFHLEKDLEFHEKVSLMFLLCADDRSQYKIVLQQLIVLSFDHDKETDLLRAWATGKVHWKNVLLEALCLMQAKRIIHRLGLDFTDLEQQFLPKNHYTASHVHVIVKLLYFVCEQLTIVECKSLIECMTKRYASIRNFIYSDNGEHLEIYLMHWLWENVIDIGQSDNNKHVSSMPCNLEPIIEWLKAAESDTLKDIVKDVANQFNGKLTAKPLQKMQTDDRQATFVEETSKVRPHHTEPKTVYQIRRKTAGIVLIVNQKTFHFESDPLFKEYLPKRRLENRYGTDRDAHAIKTIFSTFGYDVRIKINRLHTEILNDIRDVANESVQYDSVIVCILSHGCKGIVYGANSVPVKIEDIEKLMITERLIGKPKVLIVQACQGEETQKAREIDYLAHDGPQSNSPIYSDLLTCISSVPGYTSIRHTEKGSWFIQTLCEKIRQFSNQKHFVDILTVVIREVSEKRGRDNECMVPNFSSTLRLDLFFPSANSLGTKLALK